MSKEGGQGTACTPNKIWKIVDQKSNKRNFKDHNFLKDNFQKLKIETYMDTLHRQVDVVEELVVVLDGHAGGEEDHDLFGKQQWWLGLSR